MPGIWIQGSLPVNTLHMVIIYMEVELKTLLSEMLQKHREDVVQAFSKTLLQIGSH